MTAYGFSGVIAHGILQAVPIKDEGVPKDPKMKRLRFKHSRYPWRATPHPFVQEKVYHSSDEAVFRSPAQGAFVSAVADHIIMGGIVFPGAGYVLMAEAAGRALAPKAALVQLRAVFFLQPLLLTADSNTTIEIVFRPGRGYEIASGLLMGNDLEGEIAKHSMGDVNGQPPTTPEMAHLPVMRLTAPSTLDAADAYDIFDKAAKISYGPTFKILDTLWASAAENAACAKLMPDIKGWVANRVHPAQLDALYQLPMLFALDGSTEGTWLLFAVDEATLGDRSSEMWGGVRGQGSDDAGAKLRLTDKTGRCVVSLNGFKGRELQASAPVTQLEHGYAIEWKNAKGEGGVLGKAVGLIAHRGDKAHRRQDEHLDLVSKAGWHARLLRRSRQ